jgi:dipeptidyl aminopeptidase/acylaminoacyl peptidase
MLNRLQRGYPRPMFTNRFAGGRPFAFLGMVLLSACASSSPAASTPAASEIPSAPASASASQARPDLAGHIVFIRVGGIYGDGTVFAANADGSDEHQLSDLGKACCAFASRDGKRVLFDTLAPDGRVTTATINFDGSDRVEIPLPDGTLNLGPGPWSPDGKQIAFEGFDDAHPEASGIYIGSADGTHLLQITQNGSLPGDWSPDGTEMLFLRDPDGDSPLPPHLFVVNVDGSGEHQVTPDEVGVQCCWGYRWSPDGSRILFPSDDGILWLINADGTDLTQLFVDEKVAHIRRTAITPTWSPDGKQVMFALQPQVLGGMAPSGLYVIDADGSGLTLVIDDNTFKREPSWVP